MKAAILILLVIAVIAVKEAFKYYINAHILAAWIAENEYAPPEEEDIQRLSTWVVQKIFKKD